MNSSKNFFLKYGVQPMKDLLVERPFDASGKTSSFIEMETISDREMTTAGWVWHFDDNKMKREELDLSIIKVNILRTIFEIIIRSSDEAHYTGWIAENVTDSYGETTTFILTSSEPLHSKGKLHSELVKYLQTVKGYLREDGGYPLKYESIPLLRLGENGFGFAAVDDAFLTRLDELYRKMKKEPNNLYRKLLDMQ